MSDLVKTTKLWQWQSNTGLATRPDVLAEEVPVTLVVNGISQAVMMTTPQDLRDFARGFCWSEGIITAWDNIYSIEERALGEGIELDIHINAEDAANLQRQKRLMQGRTGCGLCGKESLDSFAGSLPLVDRRIRVGHQQIQDMLAVLKQYQTLNADSGGLHASALFSAEGDLVCLREDVGRHNALDKVIGATGPSACAPCVLVMTSRMSYELVEKSAKAGVEVIVALSAVTQLARDRAEKSGITLIGFARPGRHNIYTHPDRIIDATNLS